MHLEKYPNVFCFLSCYEYGDMIPKGTFYFPYKALFFFFYCGCVVSYCC